MILSFIKQFLVVGTYKKQNTDHLNHDSTIHMSNRGPHINRIVVSQGQFTWSTHKENTSQLSRVMFYLSTFWGIWLWGFAPTHSQGVSILFVMIHENQWCSKDYPEYQGCSRNLRGGSQQESKNIRNICIVGTRAAHQIQTNLSDDIKSPSSIWPSHVITHQVKWDVHYKLITFDFDEAKNTKWDK